MFPFLYVWLAGGARVALFEETIFALGAIAAVLGEVLVWRTARSEIQREIAEVRAEARSSSADLREVVAGLRAEVADLRAHLDRSLDLDRRLVRLELSATSDEAADD